MIGEFVPVMVGEGRPPTPSFARRSGMTGYVYLMTNRPHGILYIGVTSDIAGRAWERRDGAVAGFTSKYELKRLVFVETHEHISLAIRRERTMKTWRRAWKVRLIEAVNPGWDDLYSTLASGT